MREKIERLHKMLCNGFDLRITIPGMKSKTNHGKKPFGFQGYSGLPHLMQWVQQNEWKKFDQKPYLDWILPVPYPTAMSGEEFVVDQEMARELKKDPKYFQCYCQA